MSSVVDVSLLVRSKTQSTWSRVAFDLSVMPLADVWTSRCRGDSHLSYMVPLSISFKLLCGLND